MQGIHINRKLERLLWLGGNRMEHGVRLLETLHLTDRAEGIRFLKSLWAEQPEPCPICGGKLDFLHHKAKKSNCDWICTVCSFRFDTIAILDACNAQAARRD